MRYPRAGAAEQSAIAPPDLCSDLKFWVASGYTAISAGSARFLHRHDVVSSITQIESEPDEPLSDFFNLDALVARRLKPYENRADRALARRAIPPEPPTAPLGSLFEALHKVLIALGRTSLPAA